MIIIETLLVIAATAFAAMLETAVSRLSVARVEELLRNDEERGKVLAKLMESKPKYVNALRLLESLGWAASALGVYASVRSVQQLTESATLWALLISAGVGFVVFGVGATTLGRQHSDRLAKANAGLIRLVAAVLSPLVRLLILLGNAITPGKGMADGPFASAAEMRELLDQVANSVIEEDERRMLHSVFELGDTVAREVMVPRTEMVWIEPHKTLRQAVSLALRSGYSRIPVVGEDIDDAEAVFFLRHRSAQPVAEEDIAREPAP